MAFGVLADVDTGEPDLLSELTLTTALRTAAMSALAARCWRARRAHDGADRQRRAERVPGAGLPRPARHRRPARCSTPTRRATASCCANLRGIAGLRVVICASAAEAVRGADIVTTVTADKRNADHRDARHDRARHAPQRRRRRLPGQDRAAPRRAAQASVFVEFEPQTRIEGEIQQMPADFPVTELWQVLRGAASGRRNAAEVTVFDSVGFALEDFSALRVMREQRPAALGLRTTLDLIPMPVDPKDLFGIIAAEPLLQTKESLLQPEESPLHAGLSRLDAGQANQPLHAGVASDADAVCAVLAAG